MAQIDHRTRVIGDVSEVTEEKLLSIAVGIAFARFKSSEELLLELSISDVSAPF
jgi:hypothetical protein